MPLPPFLRAALDWTNRSSEEPLRLVRLAAGALLVLGTGIALTLGVSGAEPRAFQLIGLFWAIYGIVAGLTSGVLEPMLDALIDVLSSVGLRRDGGGYSAIEALVARGEYAAAAEAYRERARNPLERTSAILRRAALLAESLGQPEMAVVELENLRDGPLSERDDLRASMALIQLYQALGQPGRAMAELRRLIDRYPTGSTGQRLRAILADLKAQRFGRLQGGDAGAFP